MLPTKSTSLATFATMLLVASAAFAQSTPTPPMHTGNAEFITVQPQGEWRASLFIGQPITNQAGETVGDINDLLFDKTGRITTAVIGVGGFLGLGEKNVAVPFNTLSFTADANGKRIVTAPLSKGRLQAAPEFKPTEKSMYMRAKETAADIGHKAVDKARELGDKAGKTIEDMRK
jgi:sporulation protein YlmC with PRC-barrel domain